MEKLSTTHRHTNGASHNRALESPEPPLHSDDVHNNGTYDLSSDMDRDSALRKINTSGALSISPELFEKIYLSPPNRVAGDLRKKFGNPTPLAIGGFLIALTPLSCDLMGWRGAGGNGAASTGSFFFFGGLLMILGSIGEFILGNTFPMVVFGSFGAFWLSYAATLVPGYNAYGAYVGSSTGDLKGLETQGFQSSFAFFQVFMGLLCVLYMILALRTNLIFFLIFLTLVPSFGCLAGAFWQLAQDPVGNATLGNRLIYASGACSFVTCILGWYLFMSIMMASLDFPISLPVFDLSKYFPSATEREAARKKKKMYEA